MKRFELNRYRYKYWFLYSSTVQLDNEFPYILTEWYLSQYDQLLIAGWFR